MGKQTRIWVPLDALFDAMELATADGANNTGIELVDRAGNVIPFRPNIDPHRKAIHHQITIFMKNEQSVAIVHG